MYTHIHTHIRIYIYIYITNNHNYLLMYSIFVYKNNFRHPMPARPVQTGRATRQTTNNDNSNSNVSSSNNNNNSNSKSKSNSNSNSSNSQGHPLAPPTEASGAAYDIIQYNTMKCNMI